MNLDSPTLSIGGLSTRTGVSVGTLRAWERRHGLPMSVRLPSGHRRYSERDVEMVNEITHRRLLGASLPGAIAAAVQRVQLPRTSIMRTVQHVITDVAPAGLSKPILVAISRAIEDEASVRADRPLLVGAFQADDFRGGTRERWEDLSRTSAATVVFVGPGTPRRRRSAAHGGTEDDRRGDGGASRNGPGVDEARGGMPLMVHLAEGDPMIREWAVICDSPRFSACLVGTERLGATERSGPRGFEAIWTVEPTAVREAARTAVALAGAQLPALGPRLAESLARPIPSESAATRTATILINRLAGELDR